MKRFVVGIDVGGTNTELAIVDNNGIVYDGIHVKTDCCDSFEDYIIHLNNGINELIVKNNLRGKIEKIGVGAPNANYFSGNIEFAPNLKWKGILPFASMLEEKSGLPVVLTNDANAAAIGEKVFGGAKKLTDFVVVTLGTGLGSGFFVNNQLLYGHDGFAGEMGHAIVSSDKKRVCGCGRYGCLETYVSATGIVKTALEKLAHDPKKSILKTINSENLSSFDIYSAAKNGDVIALEVFDDTARILAIALANVVTITSPQAIFLAGGLALSGDVLMNPLTVYFDHYLLKLYRGKVNLLFSSLLDKNTGLLGAAALAFENNEV